MLDALTHPFYPQPGSQLTPPGQMLHAVRDKDSLQIWDLKATWIYPFYNLDDLMARHKYFRDEKAKSYQPSSCVIFSYRWGGGVLSGWRLDKQFCLLAMLNGLVLISSILEQLKRRHSKYCGIIKLFFHHKHIKFKQTFLLTIISALAVARVVVNKHYKRWEDKVLLP